jgi:putative ABC transport system substrate-binding protein
VAVVATIGGDVVALSAKKATTTVPIVFISGGDPVELKLIQSFNRPGANVTGVSVVTVGSFAKRLEILREMVPGSGAIGLLANPTNPGAASMTGEILEAARALNQPIEIAEASAAADFEPAIAHLARRGVRALLPHPDVYYLGHREQLVSTVARHRLPAIYHFREFAVAVW